MRTRCHQRAYGFRLEIELRISNDPVVNDRIRRIISMALLLSALGMFITFHFMAPVEYPRNEPCECGWTMWRELFDLLRHPERIKPMDGVIASSWLMFSLLIVASPFLSMIWPRSRFAWCLVTIFSGIAALSFSLLLTIMALQDGLAGRFLLGGWFLVIAPLANFLGLLLARRWREAPRNSPVQPPNFP